MSPDASAADQAFEALLDTLRDGIALARDAALDEAEAAEGYRFFTHQLRAGLATFFDNDPLRPRFTPLCYTRLRQPWAHDCSPLDIMGPVPHAIYDLAPLDGGSSYLLRGHRGTVDYFSVFLYSGGGWTGVMPERLGDFLNHRDLVVEADGSFEIELAATRTGRAKNFLELDADAHTILVRQFFADPDAEEPARYQLERTPPAGPVAPLTDAEVARRLRAVDTFVRATGNDNFRNYGHIWPVQDDWVANEFVMTHLGHGHAEFKKGSPAGMYVSPDHWYVYCHYDIAPGDALVIRMETPRADWWSIYAQSRYVQTNVNDLEARNFVSSGNVVYDDDGRATIVAAHEDPGLPNWLDLGGRKRGQVLMLWSVTGVDPDKSVPTIETEVVPAASLRTPD
jgi:hypothetical protein